MKQIWMQVKQGAAKFWREEQGIGTLEIVLIIAVVVIIFIAFKDFIIKMVEDFIAKSKNKIDKSFS